MKPYILIYSIGSLLFVLPGCKHRVSPSPYLRPLTSYLDTQTTKHNITLRVKQLSAEDCMPLFGNRTKRLFKNYRRRQPIYPIQLSITNGSNKSLLLDPKNIEVPLTDYKIVAQRLNLNAGIQAFGGLLAGLLISGLLALGCVGALGTGGALLAVIGAKAVTPLAILSGSALLVTPFFLVIGTPVISTMKGVQASKHNHMITQEIKDHTLQQALVIKPHTTIDTLIFVAKQNYKKQFGIVLTNLENAQDQVLFRVSLYEPCDHRGHTSSSCK